MVNTGPRPESAQDAPARQQGGAATLGRRSTMPVSHTARSYSPISPASRTSPAVRRSATVSSLDRTDQRRGQQRVSEESSSESGSFIGLPRNPSWSGDLNRAPSDCSNDSECRVPCLPDWPELDRAAFERGKAVIGSMEMEPSCFSRDDLCHLALEIFVEAGLPEELAADVGRVRRFILAVRESMYDNAYHNFYHVFDVTQTVSVIARRTGTLARLDAWERFALLAASLCHDLEHPGVTSIFLDRAGSTVDGVAGAFRDTVLEKHHTLRAFEVMVDNDIGILKGVSSKKYWSFRNNIAGCILATDFAKHASYCAQARALAQEGAQRPMSKQLEMELIVKCADISNVLKPFPVARRWALRVTDEFFLQGDVERSLGLNPISNNCDRRITSRVKSQVGFINFVCAPFFDTIATLYPVLRPDVARMHQNSKIWAGYTDTELEESRVLDIEFLPHRELDHEQDPFEDLLCFTSAGDEHDFLGDPLTDPLSSVHTATARLTPGLRIMVNRARYSQESFSSSSSGAGSSVTSTASALNSFPEAGEYM